MSIKAYKKGADVQLSRHFHLREFECKCLRKECAATFVDSRLIAALEIIRAEVKKPLVVLSGFRCKRHNREVGGAPESQHPKGTAADVTCAAPIPTLAAIAESIPDIQNGGVGLYDTFLHIDTRGTKARWDLRTRKSAASAEEKSTLTR